MPLLLLRCHSPGPLGIKFCRSVANSVNSVDFEVLLLFNSYIIKYMILI